MIPRHHRTVVVALVLVAAVVAAIAAPSASASYEVRPNPDNQQPASAGNQHPAPAVLPNPDNQQAAPAVLPNPDNQHPAPTSGPVSVPSTQVHVVSATPDQGFDWGDAGIGAGAGFALTIIGLGAVLVATNYRHGRGQPATSRI